MVAAGPLDGFLADREALIASAVPGTAAARALSDLTDEAILERTRVASSAVPVPYAVFALGGYGARRLLPHSDIDLLIISTGTSAELEPLVRALLYPIWDAGISLGHQIRSPKGQLRALSEDLQNATGFLTGRVLAGDEGFAARLVADAFRRLRKDARRTQTALLARPRPGSPYLLEPDLKEGAGGQRDIDELVWHSALGTGSPAYDASELLNSGALTLAEASAVQSAQDRLTAARWLLHASAPRAGNVLSVEDAVVLGIDAEELQRSLENVHYALLSARARLAGARAHPAGPFSLQELRALALAGEAGLDASERAARLGRLDPIVPGFADLMTRRRPALTHRYTVGAHCLRSLAAVGETLSRVGEPGADDALRDVTLVAALTHDVGKRVAGPDHALRGAREAGVAATALGMSAEDAHAVETLVREHLLLPEIALRADLSDEDTVLAAAARIGDARLVAPLFALTAADMHATGPDVWTPWRAALLGDLASKLEVALSPEIDGAGIERQAQRTRRAALLKAASAGSSRAVLAFLEQAPTRYLARRTPEQVLTDAHLVRTLSGPGHAEEVGVDVRPGPTPETWLLDVVTRDRSGLFAGVAGAIALSGLDVLSAEVFTGHRGIALDTFTVQSATRAPVTDATWSALRRNLHGLVRGRLDLENRLAERRRHYRAASANGGKREIVLGPRGGFGTSVRVRAADRVGLLHDLGHAIERSGFDIRRAVVSTVAGAADDIFEITDAEGAPPEPDELEQTLRPALEDAIAEEPVTS